MRTLQNNDQTRALVIAAYLGGATAIGWVLRAPFRGYLYNPAGSPNQTGLVPNVQSALIAIGGNSLLVMGNAGIAITQNILISTTNGQNSDDFVSSELLDGVTFIGSLVVGAS